MSKTLIDYIFIVQLWQICNILWKRKISLYRHCRNMH